MKSNQVWCATQCDGCEPENFAAAGGLAKFHRPTEEPIVGRHNDHYWKGSVIGPKVSQKVGIFPTSAVQLLDTHNASDSKPRFEPAEGKLPLFRLRLMNEDHSVVFPVSFPQNGTRSSTSDRTKATDPHRARTPGVSVSSPAFCRSTNVGP
ncbi:unnamed protein product [Soboliphyme baturini]|uniref:DUF3444 domain-containing protein n=1 Tax=Soboliphyme baturini TaxID=241478 RepID=A0A183INT1_9BILA|nr:unnamed protein product [Soboliphyme baturini]